MNAVMQIESAEQLLASEQLFQNTLQKVISASQKAIREKKEFIEQQLEPDLSLGGEAESALLSDPLKMKEALSRLVEADSVFNHRIVSLYWEGVNLFFLSEELRSIQEKDELVLSLAGESEAPASELLADAIERMKPYQDDYRQRAHGLSVRLHDLEWLLEELLLSGAQKEVKFQKQVASVLEPLKPAQNSPKQLKKSEVLQVSEKQEDVPEADEGQSKMQAALAKRDRPSPYDPFSFSTMQVLKKVCREVGSTRTKGLLKVLQQPHTVGAYLRHLEEEYDPSDIQPEEEYLDDVLQSQTPREFLRAFLRMKFLAYGYYDARDTPIHFNEESNSFDIEHEEVFLRLTRQSLETPKNIFQRLLRILFGYEDPDTLGKAEHGNIINMLKEDFIVTKDEHIAFENKIRSLQ